MSQVHIDQTSPVDTGIMNTELTGYAMNQINLIYLLHVYYGLKKCYALQRI